MKKILALVAAFAAYSVLSASPVIYVIDMAQVYSNYYKAKSAQSQLQSSVDAAKQQLQTMDKQAKDYAKQLQAIQEKAQNPALSRDAQEKIMREEGAPIYQKLRQLEAEMKAISDQTNERVSKNAQQIRAVHMQEIGEVIKKIAEDKKADFIIEKGACHFSKPQYDISQEVITAINAGAQK